MHLWGHGDGDIESWPDELRIAQMKFEAERSDGRVTEGEREADA